MNKIERGVFVKILVAVKRVVDFNVKIRVKADGSDVETNNVKMSINPFDEIAVEEAIRLKEQSIASEVIAVSVGAKTSEDTLRHALAMGADRAILVQTEAVFEPINIAYILEAIAAQESPELILLGKQAIDDDCNQTAQMLAGLLNWPQATFVSKLTLQNKQAEVLREVDGGLEALQVSLPAVLSSDLRLNEPRYISMPNIMKARQKPLKNIMLDELSLDMKQHTEILSVAAPATREAGIKVSSMEELMDKLKNESKVLS